MLFGGEVAVLVMVEAIARLLPGVLGNAESLVDESHEDGLLETPVYTKPARLARAGGAGGAALGRPRPDRPLAPGSGTCSGPPPAGPICWPRCDPATLDTADRAALDGGGFPVPARDVAK